MDSRDFGLSQILANTDTVNTIAVAASNSFAASETAKLAVGMVALLTAGGLALYALDASHRKKVSLEEKQSIDELHHRYLSSLSIIAPFVVDPKDGVMKATTPYGKRVFQEYKQRPSFHDPVLDYHVEYILDAISYLERYYDSRLERYKATGTQGKEDDNISIVICYAAFFLNKSLTFKGYETDIDLLKGLNLFLHNFSSIKDKIDTGRFEHLKYVVKNITLAIKILEEHKKKLTIQEPIEAISHQALLKSKALIKNFAKLINPYKTSFEKKILGEEVFIWDKLEYASIKDLSEGIIKQEFPNEHWGAYKYKLEVAESPFKLLLLKTAKRYWDVLSGNTKGLSYVELANNPYEEQGKIEKLNRRQAEDEKKQLLRFSQNCQNFLTLTSVSGTLEPLSSLDQLKAAAATLYDFDKLNNEILTLRDLCSELLMYVKQRGEIFLVNPQHCRCIFEVLICLSEQIIRSSEKLRESLVRDLTDLPPSQENLARDITDHNLLPLEKTINENIQKLKYTRTENVYQAKLKQMNESEHELLGKVADISRRHSIKTGYSFSRNDSRFSSSADSVDFPQVVTIVESSDALDSKLAEVSQRIQTIGEQAETDHRSLSAYWGLYGALVQLALKSKEMKSDRQEKGRKLAALAYSFCVDVGQFLAGDKQTRKTEASLCAQKIRVQLVDQNNAFLDQHKNGILGQIFSRGGFFRTVSRAKANRVEEACTELVRRLNK